VIYGSEALFSQVRRQRCSALKTSSSRVSLQRCMAPDAKRRPRPGFPLRVRGYFVLMTKLLPSGSLKMALVPHGSVLGGWRN
jgi:hypothetical protein